MPDKDKIEELWEDYKQTGDINVRNDLVVHYMPLVKSVARCMCSNNPYADYDDLVSEGVFGLVNAIDKYDLSRGLQFSSFARSRIRGAMLDSLRDGDWTPRLARMRQGYIKRVIIDTERSLGRKPTDDEIAIELNMSEEDYKEFAHKAMRVNTISLNRKWFDTDSDKEFCEIDTIENTKSEDPADKIKHDELKQSILQGLSRGETLIVTLYYYEGITMKAIGDVIGKSESRVSQIHASLMGRFKSRRDLLDKLLDMLN